MQKVNIQYREYKGRCSPLVTPSEHIFLSDLQEMLDADPFNMSPEARAHLRTCLTIIQRIKERSLDPNFKGIAT